MRNDRDAKLALATTPGKRDSADSITCSLRGETIPSIPSTTSARSFDRHAPARRISVSSSPSVISRGS